MIRERIFLAAALTAVLTAAGAAQSQQAAIDRLKRAERLTRTLQGSATDRMAVPLAAGQFVRIDVMQIGTDVRVIFRDPDNHIVAEVDSPTGGYGPETVVAVVETAGGYSLEVSLLPGTSGKGTYEVTLSEGGGGPGAGRGSVRGGRP